MRRLSLPLILKCFALLSIAALVGCESADVDPEHIAASGSSGGASGGSSDGSPQGPGGESYQTIAVSPPSALHATVGDFTVLEVEEISGYTFTWTLSDTSLGNIGTKTGKKVVYTPTRIPTTGSAVQIIRVTGRNPSDTTVIYRGISKITHRAPGSGGSPGITPPTP